MIMYRLLTIGVLLAIWLPIYGQKETPKPGSNQYGGSATTSPTPPTPAKIKCVIEESGPTIECDYPKADSPRYFSRLFAPENIPNLLLVTVGIGGIIAAGFTLRKIERQIVVAEADTNAMIRAERAWIVVSVTSPNPGSFVYKATNVGRTPAMIKSIWCRPLIVEREGQLEVYPDKVTGESLFVTPPQLLPPTATCVVLNITEAELENSASAFSNIFVYGRILYFNTLELEPSEVYETRWLYWHVPLNGALPFPDPGYPQHNSYT